jgi:hypothetical protein
MTAEELFKMSYEEFAKALRENSQAREELPFDDETESLEKQIEEFAKFRQSEEGIKKLIEASENI